MKERPKNAWLITWENGLQSERPLARRSRIASILPFRTQAKVVQEVMKAIFVSDYPLTLAEKYHFGLNAEQRRQCMRTEADERFLYGSHEYLFARKVKNLTRSIFEDGSEELRWTEFPRYTIDERTEKSVVSVDEREAFYREKPDEEEV